VSWSGHWAAAILLSTTRKPAAIHRIIEILFSPVGVYPCEVRPSMNETPQCGGCPTHRAANVLNRTPCWCAMCGQITDPHARSWVPRKLQSDCQERAHTSRPGVESRDNVGSRDVWSTRLLSLLLTFTLARSAIWLASCRVRP
jgi:hypothetical protein